MTSQETIETEKGEESEFSWFQRKPFWSWIILVGIIIVLLLIVIFLLKLVEEKKIGNDAAPGQNSSTGSKANCPPVFTYEFTDYSKMDAFQPIGSITGASRGRSYMTIKKGETVPVYLPLDAKLISVIYSYRGPDAPVPEYGFRFDIGCDMTLLFDHLDVASDELKQYAPKEAARTSATNDTLSVKIKGGTLLGYSDGTPNARTFDFLVMDRNNEINYINPERWQWDQSKYSVCPYDYYTGGLKQKYYDKIGEHNNSGFKKSDGCGQISYDIDGTISGGWFATPDATDTKGKFMMIGERMGTVDLTVKNDSEGTLLRISDYSPALLPGNVGIGQSACYEGFGNDWIYLSLVDNDTIKLNNGSGKCPAGFPEAGAQSFDR